MNPALFVPAALLMTCSPQDVPTQASEAPVEYGQVRWSRQLESSLARAKADAKPVVLCFQEVPG